MKQFWKRIGAMALMVAVVGGAATAAVVTGIQQNGNGTQSNATVSNGAGGAELGGYQQFGIRMAALTIEPEDFAANGVSEAAESAYQITATVEPEDASDKTVSWSVAWKDPASEWATGKTVTDYVTVTASEDTLTGTLACMQAFGEQIVVNVVSNDNAEATASCTVDYRKKITGLRSVVQTSSGGSAQANQNAISTNLLIMKLDTTFRFGYVAEYSDYTVDSEISEGETTISWNPSMQAMLESALGIELSDVKITAGKMDNANPFSFTLADLLPGYDLSVNANYNRAVNILKNNGQQGCLVIQSYAVMDGVEYTTSPAQLKISMTSTTKVTSVTLGDSSLVF